MRARQAKCPPHIQTSFATTGGGGEENGGEEGAEVQALLECAKREDGPRLGKDAQGDDN